MHRSFLEELEEEQARGSKERAGKQEAGTEDERDAAKKLGELFGSGWPEIDKGKVISFPNLSQKEEGLPIGDSEALVNQ